jgi:hypothetical protein
MTISKRSGEELPLMEAERVHLSFGEKRGLEAESSIDHNVMVLTDRRLIRVSGTGASRDVAFISLGDAQVAEVRRRSRGKKPLLRVALLLAGAVAALLTIGFAPISLPLATILALAGSYHLVEHLKVSQRGSIHFRTGQEEIEIPFQGDIADQAYTFVNRFFQLKASPPSSTPKASQRGWLETEALHQQWWRRMDEQTGRALHPQ